jgi:hypothetical protein
VSTLAYATLTEKRKTATPGKSRSSESPGVGTWVDALAALVPAEVLAVHGILLATMTTTVQAQNGDPITTITNSATLAFVFYTLVGLAMLLYVGARIMAKKWDQLDYARMCIPGLAFVGWTMLQKTTAFDAAWPKVTPATRTAVALIGAVVLGLVASMLAYQADKADLSK